MLNWFLRFWSLRDGRKSRNLNLYIVVSVFLKEFGGCSNIKGFSLFIGFFAMFN
ncbi:hypothetical protein SLEP1_g58432 [Rubroshorea leprosula]|uniref:Uncharacterized protein n=1 Tax=Rubroshorea leprosula TaxID=152421 RepID=A0AAV5MQT1_9ROSI|nr:hypothetical protein SLEP1_g58432 [Rubroshorea leprosula]